MADVKAGNLPSIGIHSNNITNSNQSSTLSQSSTLPKSGVNSLLAALGNSMLPAMVHISTEV